MVQLLSQKKSNVPLRWLSDSLRVWSDEDRFEAGLIGMCPSRWFVERSKNSSSWSSNNDPGMLPLNRLDLKCSSLRFFKFLKAIPSFMHAYS
jgi:hypothetical protein